MSEPKRPRTRHELETRYRYFRWDEVTLWLDAHLSRGTNRLDPLRYRWVSSNYMIGPIMRSRIMQDYQFYHKEADVYFGVADIHLAGHCLEIDGYDRDLFYWTITVRPLLLKDLMHG